MDNQWSRISPRSPGNLIGKLIKTSKNISCFPRLVTNQEWIILKKTINQHADIPDIQHLLVLSSDHPQANGLLQGLEQQGFQFIIDSKLESWLDRIKSTSIIHGYLVDLAFSQDESFLPTIQQALDFHPAPVFYLVFDYSSTYDRVFNETSYHGILWGATPLEILAPSIKRTIQQVKCPQKMKDPSANLSSDLDQPNRSNGSKAIIYPTHEKDSWWVQLMDHVIWNNPTPIAIFDQNLHFIFVSNQYLQHYDIEKEQVIGKHHYEVFTQVPEKWKEIHTRALAGEILANKEDYYYKEDGTREYTSWECRPWYQADGFIGGIILYTSVITPQKTFERNLSVSERKLRFLYQSLNQGIVYQDVQGNILGANPAAQRILGMSQSELQTSSSLDPRWHMITETGELVEGKDHPVMQALRDGQPIGPRLRGLQTPEGQVTWISISAIPIFDPDTHLITEVYAVFEDLTPQKVQEEALKKQIEEKRIILAETQHRIKNNFASIEALLSLQSQQDVHQEAKEALQEAGSRVSSLRILYERLLQSAEMRTVQMALYLEDLAETVCSTINPSVQPTLDLDCVPVIFGPNQAFPVGAIMVELMTNSLKYGFPSLQTQPIDEPLHSQDLESASSSPPYLRVTLQEGDQQRFILTVEDNGVGFDPEKLSQQSNSFGLTLIRLMTEQLDGELVTTSNPGSGTKTSITFPGTSFGSKP